MAPINDYPPHIAPLLVEVGECFEWVGEYRPVGIAGTMTPLLRWTVDGRRFTSRVAREVWEWACGEPPAGFVVFRECRNHRCVRLDHLRCAERGGHLRGRGELAKHLPSTIASITAGRRRSSTTKYSLEMAREIRRLRDDGASRREIVERTQVGKSMVDNILQGRAWRESPVPRSVFELGGVL